MIFKDKMLGEPENLPIPSYHISKGFTT
jgi:hypothetical protein